MNEVFNKKEEANLNEAMKRKVFVTIGVYLFIIVKAFIDVYNYGGFSKLFDTYPILESICYLSLGIATYGVIVLVLKFFKGSNKIIDKASLVLDIPFSFWTHFIFIPFKRYVRPYLLPIFVYVAVFGIVSLFTFLSFIMLDENAGKRLPLIMYLIITIYTTLISYAVNFIFKHYIRRDELIEFKEGKNEKEKIQNYHLYELGFNNNKKVYEVAMRYFHQDNVKIVIYSLYFIVIFTSSIITFGGFFNEITYIEDLFKVLLYSFGTYICFERIVKHKNLFDIVTIQH